MIEYVDLDMELMRGQASLPAYEDVGPAPGKAALAATPETAPLEIGEDESLNETVHRRTRATDKDFAENWSYSSRDLMNEGKLSSTNTVAQNLAKKSPKEQADFQRLTEEMDLLKPLALSWSHAGTAANTIAATQGIDMFNPERYRDGVLSIHKVMDTKTSTTTNTSNASSQITLLWNQASSAMKVESAQKTLTSITSDLLLAKNGLVHVQNELMVLSKRKEIQENEEELAKVEEKIKKVASIITGIANFIAVMGTLIASAGATAPAAIDSLVATNFAASLDFMVAEREHEADHNRAPKGTSAVQKGAEWVGGKGDLIEKALKSTVFKDQITKITTNITSLKKDIEGLGLADVQLRANDALLTMGKVKAAHEAAAGSVTHEKAKFQQCMQDIGRTFDRMHIDDRTADGKAEADVKSPGTAPGQRDSMEAVLGVYAALQQRGSSRKAFKELLALSPHARTADVIMDRALDSSGDYPMVEGDRDGSTRPVAMDEDPLKQGLRSEQQRRDARAVRSAVSSTLNIIKVIDDPEVGDVHQTAIEKGWERMVSEALKGVRAKASDG